MRMRTTVGRIDVHHEQGARWSYFENTDNIWNDDGMVIK
jgi:hypothetical protein